MFKNILVPIDLSDDTKGQRAIAVTKDMVKSDDTKLVLLSVLPIVPGYIVSELPMDYSQKAVTDAEDKLKKISTDAGFPASTITMIKHGNPYNEILMTVQEEGIDLIIMSSHQPAWEDYLFGSVAAEVVRHAKCSVLVER